MAEPTFEQTTYLSGKFMHIRVSLTRSNSFRLLTHANVGQSDISMKRFCFDDDNEQTASTYVRREFLHISFFVQRF